MEDIEIFIWDKRSFLCL